MSKEDEPRRFATLSGRPIDRLYSANGGSGGYATDIGDPGTFPYARGVSHAGDGRQRWARRSFADCETPAAANARYRALVAAGETSLGVRFNSSTLAGPDLDPESGNGETGAAGVAIVSLADMETLFDGIPLADVTTTMAIDDAGPIVFAMYLVVAERQGVDWTALSGGTQNDVLGELVVERSSVLPSKQSLRVLTDMAAFCVRHAPRWDPIVVDGSRMREAGASAVQELAFALRSGLEYLKLGVDAGLSADELGPHLSFSFCAQMDLFEEVAKYRAARRLWARAVRARFQPTDERSWQLRFHAQTAIASLTTQQPYNNVVRTALQALSAVLGGAGSLHAGAFDEVFARPSREGATLALRTQQILAHETGVADIVDPFGGSYFVETLTNEMERDAQAYFDTIDGMGGMVAAIADGFPQREIETNARRYQQSVQDKARTIVGVNDFVNEEAPRGNLSTAMLSAEGAAERHAALGDLRRTRHGEAVQGALDRLRGAAANGDNVMAFILDAVRTYATIGEICAAFQEPSDRLNRTLAG